MSLASRLLTVLLLISVQMNAQGRKYTFGPRLDLAGGGGTDPYFAGTQHRGSFYSEVYPSMVMRSDGERDTILATYAFGYRRTIGSSNYQSNSHVASATFSRALSPTWKFTLSDSFQITPDFATFNSTRGDTTAIDGFRFVFSPLSTGRSTRTNTATIGTEYRWGADSALSLSASLSLLAYPDSGTFRGILSNQQRFSETVTYSHRISEHGTWTAGYTGAILTFKDFDTIHSHTASVGYSHQIGRDLTIQVSGGPSYVQGSQAFYTSTGTYSGYNAAASLRKTINGKDTVSLHYNDAIGDTSGLGSVSDIRSAGFGWTEMIGRSMNVFADLSAFDSRNRIGSIYNARGISAAAGFGMVLTRELSLNAGAQYQRYDHTSLFAFNQKRVFFSLRYNAPELWKFSR